MQKNGPEQFLLKGRSIFAYGFSNLHKMQIGVGGWFEKCPLCKLGGGWVGQHEFALFANWKNRTQKWTTPNEMKGNGYLRPDEIIF